MTATTNPWGVRLVRLPACRMVTSGMDTGAPFAEGGKLRAFDRWFSRIDNASDFLPRDFLWHDAQIGGMEWWYVYTPGMDTGAFDIVDFDGGLYAAAISVDEDDENGEQVHAGIQAWVAATGCLAPDDRARHRCMFHVITPKEAQGPLGYCQLDIYVPVKLREG